MDFKKLGEVTLVEEAINTANVLIEEDGEIKRVPKTEVGGTGFPTAIIKDSEYDNTIAGLSTAVTVAIEYECINMTFEEAYEIMSSGGYLNVVGMFSMEGAINIQGMAMFIGSMLGVPCIAINFNLEGLGAMIFYWTSDGISTEEPSLPK